MIVRRTSLVWGEARSALEASTSSINSGLEGSKEGTSESDCSSSQPEVYIYQPSISIGGLEKLASTVNNSGFRVADSPLPGGHASERATTNAADRPDHPDLPRYLLRHRKIDRGRRTRALKRRRCRAFQTVSRTSPVCRSICLNSLSSPSDVACQRSPSTHVTPVTKRSD